MSLFDDELISLRMAQHKANQMTHQPFQNTASPQATSLMKYLNNVLTGRIAQQGFQDIGGNLDKMAQGDPEAVMQYFGAGGITKVKVNMFKNNGILEIGKIETPKELRGKGLAEEKLKEILRIADNEGIPVALSPSSDFGANKAKLTKWYKRHGFVDNKGKNKDYGTQETLIRAPK